MPLLTPIALREKKLKFNFIKTTKRNSSPHFGEVRGKQNPKSKLKKIASQLAIIKYS